MRCWEKSGDTSAAAGVLYLAGFPVTGVWTDSNGSFSVRSVSVTVSVAGGKLVRDRVLAAAVELLLVVQGRISPMCLCWTSSWGRSCDGDLNLQNWKQGCKSASRGAFADLISCCTLAHSEWTHHLLTYSFRKEKHRNCVREMKVLWGLMMKQETFLTMWEESSACF